MEFQENIPGCTLDEIALEGLEGLTISTLWIRLNKRKNFPIALDDQSKRFIWKIIFVMTNVLEQHKKPIQISKVLKCVQAAK
ncbi:general transcription factor 3C polypeptide 1-like [Daphnia magna]|uniref:general transcription factor 3C polypeptide 1-like n=1 Tax=Daphnia magna TaxID=35525 RepID=UPI001E1BDE52|nr:general transcription factor 3C polypeptide 1-like [Daphnia magna]